MVLKLPAFTTIKPETIVPALEKILNENRREINAILQRTHEYTWNNLLAPLEDLQDRLSQFWSPIGHLHAVLDSQPLRDAYQAALPKLTEYSTEIAQNELLFRAVQSLVDSPAYANLDYAQRKLLENELRDFRLAGVALPADQKIRFAQLQKEAAELGNRFSNNVLDATQGWTLLLTERKELAGMPEHALSAAAEAAQQAGKTGWLLTLEFPCYHAVVTYADAAALREKIYTAYVTRASELGPQTGGWDNSPVMLDILRKRYERAQLLGFNNYAEYSLATKMVDKPQQVLTFLRDLAQKARKTALQDVAELKTFAHTQYNIEQLNAWDLAYYSEKLRQHKYDLSQETLRPYFPVDHVLKGLFELVHQLFGIVIREKTGVDVWHKDARFFEVYDATSNELRSGFYIDLYARPHKRGGAWMDECAVRRRLNNGEIQLPVAYLTCNFSAPTAEQPALLTHEEVETLFHEFGHTLHHLLTKINYAGVSGINGVPWDAVEFPSQFMEEWCWQKPVLNNISHHYQTGAVLPDELFDKMQRAKNFQAGLQMLRQIEFALFDFRLHVEFNPDFTVNDIQRILDEVRREVSVFPAPTFNRFQHSFSHIFGGGYAAGYYSYKWAEVLSCDAFSLFEEKGIFDPSTGKAFLTNVLEQGGARDPKELFAAFRGRQPQVDALLRRYGMV